MSSVLFHGGLIQRAAVTGLALLFASQIPARAEEREFRDYRITLDGKPKQVGEYHMTITQREDGSISMAGQASVNVRYFVVSYRYSYKGTEIWKNHRLTQLTSSTDDDGKRYTVSAAPQGNDLSVTVNRNTRLVRGDVWLTSYWHLPPAASRNRPIALLDADTGKTMNATLRHVGPVQMVVAGQLQSCAHYRLTGDVKVDLWYDAQEKLVRQDWEEDGHRTLLELTGVRRQ